MDKKTQAEGQLTAALNKLSRVRVKDATSGTNLQGAKENIQQVQTIVKGEPGPTPPPPPPPNEFKPNLWWTTDLSKFALQPKHNVSTVKAPDGSGDNVILFSVGPNDGVTGKDPNREYISSDPRGQALTTGTSNTQELWCSGAFWLPSSSFPKTWPSGSNSWGNLWEWFGKPYNESPPVEIDVRPSGIGWQRNGKGSFETIWREPYKLDHKYEYLIHIVPSSDKSVGLVEMWLDDFTKSKCSLHMATLDGTNTEGPQQVIPQLYREYGLINSVVDLYHWFPAVGSTKASVWPYAP